MNKDLFNDYKYTQYSFSIFFNDKKYNKKLIKSYLDKYQSNKNFGKDYWILKNSKSGQGIGTFIVKTNELYNLENNIDFNNEIIKFPSKTTYIVQKYLEKPILYDNKKYDIRAHILLITKLDNNNNIYYKFYLYKEFIAKFTSIDYNLHNTDKKSHLTNLSIQEDYNKYDLRDLITNDIYNKIYNDVYFKIKKFIKSDKFIKKLKSINDYPYIYDIFGVDILLDEDYNSYLIDFNTLPGLKTHLLNPKRQSSTIDSYNTIVNLLECIFLRLITVYTKLKNLLNR